MQRNNTTDPPVPTRRVDFLKYEQYSIDPAIKKWLNTFMIHKPSVLRITRFTPAGSEEVPTIIASEAPVSLTVNGQSWLTFQCTPDHLESLAIGFLYNGGFIESMAEVENVHVCDSGENIDVWLTRAVKKPLSWRRTSGCYGGTGSAEPRDEDFKPVTDPVTFRPAQIFSLMNQFLDAQVSHAETGGVHTSALADGDTQLFQIIDIGRHNSFDKIAGRILMDGIKPQAPVLLTSGRISSDMLYKAVRMQAPLLISMRSASLLGIKLAEEWGVTAISSARRERFNLLSHPERILTY